ncbi:recombinase family protein [Acutalibacter sp. 1XD8-36]|uniref:recombinase family protein n=1 Tax=Acutalibacter sp. 1XD8-36 TaxID=2320852 RepID=UPI001411D6E3|nr:recombinase family protein [Acutalibacter sp. 1XD8-36]NBJ90190.1 transposase [Acutalibacter sp. 1XD8-36]
MSKRLEQKFKVAIYLRLSKDDGDLSLSENGKSESNSIHNQRELLMEYISNHPEMDLYDEFKDDGYTGTNFDRPDFQRMLESIRRGEVNCVLVKDLSRFGRDYIDCGKYIEKVFPRLGVRFISLNDHFDTAVSSSSDNIIVPFKNLINDSYSRDISIKVRTNLDVKRRQGDYIGNYAPYGYRKDPSNKNSLLIDEDAAKVVRDIFKWKVEGFSPEQIAEKLNTMGILSPAEYKRAAGIRFATSFQSGAKAYWSHVSVRRILTNEIYIGVLVQGKRMAPTYKTKKTILRDSSEWVRIENTHEAIISRPQFDLVQQLMTEDTRASAGGGAVQPFCGRIFCGDCGSPMFRKTVNTGKKRYVYYVCSANKQDKSQCSKHSIRENVLDETVLATVQRQIEVILEMEKAMSEIDALSWETSEVAKIEAGIRYQDQIIEKNNALRLGIYEDLHDGILTKDEFLSMKEEFTARIDEAQGIIAQLNVDKGNIQHGMSQQQGWLAQFKQYRNITEISRLVVVNLIERVNIYEGAEIEVVFRQADQFESIMNFLAEHRQLVREVG